MNTDVGLPLFCVACQKGDIEVARMLLKHNADINQSSKDGSTALHMACKRNDIDLVKFLPYKIVLKIEIYSRDSVIS
jgi:ankyrin repeat protein